MKEVIICSAIMLHDGYIVRGHRHNDCIRTIRGIPRYNIEASVENQGFMTSHNRFVDRYDGYKIHFGVDKEKQLFSEDVY